MDSASRQHVALIAFPFASHPGNLFAFARALAAAAPDITFSFLTTTFAAATLPPAPPAANLRLCHVADGVPEGGLPPGTTIHGRIGMFLRATPGNFRDGVRAAEEEVGVKVSCVVSDAFLWMTADVAEEIGAQWLPLWTCAPAALLAHVSTDQLRERFGVEKQATAGWADELVDFIPGLSCLRIRDIPDEIVTNWHSDLSILLHRMGNQLTSATAVALNTFDGLDTTIDAALASLFKKTLPIGPLNLLSSPPPLQPGDEKCLSWLDGQEDATVAYVSFGTMVLMPTQSDVSEIAQGLESSGVRFLWSLREEARAGLLPPGFLERTAGRGLVVPWAPQVRVLGHRAVGAFVTHCGWNAVMESVTSGVPMACLPSFADQKTNARMVSAAWGIGEALRGEKVTKEEVVRSMEIVMMGEEGRRMRERIGNLREKAAEAVGPGGSSSENFKSVLEMVRGTAN
uniref:Myricetin 3-O-rhamnosyltransferase UGT77B2 n=1 Tax=Crocosmia x crocosmiiflora TaxID=1053288 RepID=U77B2_CROXC|nr:RecName: Full=Myricetin 3-O-rhamnosyltransferase UGT77B2; AltName: Full=UDP-glucosyltransferase 1; Short=CcUGT1 [Crocosmia x crocosmiiflora]AXB26715.1 myricetin-3O-rhamnosyltransferase [Crocosmia x crocosmiiflora]